MVTNLSDVKGGEGPLASPETERDLIAALLARPSLYGMLPYSLRADHFTEPGFQRMFERLERAYVEEQGVALEAGSIPVEDSRLLDGARPGPSTSEGVRSQALLLKELAYRRAIIAAGEEAIRTARGSSSTDQLVQSVYALAVSAEDPDQTAPFVDLQNALHQVVATAADFAEPGPSDDLRHSATLEAWANGLRRGHLVAVGGEINAGKTALALQLAVRASASGRSAAYVSGRNSVGQLALRILAILGQIDLEGVSAECPLYVDFPRLVGAVLDLKANEICLSEAHSLPRTALQLRALARQRQLDLIVIDDVDLLVGETASDARGQWAILRNLAQTTGATLIVLGRAPEFGFQPSGFLAMASHFADELAFLSHESGSRPKTPTVSTARLSVILNRRGPCGEIDLSWRPERLSFDMGGY